MATLCRNPTKLLALRNFSSSTPFPSFRALKAAIQKESDPDKLFHIMESTSELPTFLRHRPLYHLSVGKLVRSNRPDLVERFLHHQKSLASTHPKSEGFWIRLMMLYSQAGLPDQSLRAFEDMQKSELVPTEKSVAAVLTCLLDNKLYDRFHQVFSDFQSQFSVAHGVISFNLALKAFCEAKSIDLASGLLVKMEESENGVRPDINSYNLLLGAYLKSGDKNGFDSVVKKIEKKGLSYSTATYNLRIMRLCKDKECVRAKKLLDEMISRGVKPNACTFNSIIHGFCKVGDFESANKVLQTMVANESMSPCSFTYFTLARHMVEEGEFDAALEISREIIKRKWVPPFETMKNLVNGLVENSKVEEAKEIVEKMKRRLKGNAVDSWTKIEAALPL